MTWATCPRAERLCYSLIFPIPSSRTCVGISHGFMWARCAFRARFAAIVYAIPEHTSRKFSRGTRIRTAREISVIREPSFQNSIVLSRFAEKGDFPIQVENMLTMFRSGVSRESVTPLEISRTCVNVQSTAKGSLRYLSHTSPSDVCKCLEDMNDDLRQYLK